MNKLFAVTGSSVADYADVLGCRLVTAIRNGTVSSEQLKTAMEKIGKAATGGLAVRNLTNLTQQALTLEELYGIDMNEPLRGVNSLMKQYGLNVQEAIHDRITIADVPNLTEKDYFVRGCTVLLDAVGGAIHHIGNIHKYARKEDVPEKTLFIITTDGMENTSHHYTYLMPIIIAEKDLVKDMSEENFRIEYELISYDCFIGSEKFDDVKSAVEALKKRFTIPSNDNAPGFGEAL